MTSIKSILFLCLLFFLSCNDAEQKKMIQGKWKCTDWTVRGESKAQVNVEFDFQEGGLYQYKNASLNEKGSYKVQGGKLYTTPENELEMAVDIEKLTTDTLIFNMSRGGTPETMLLVKVN
jgi:hypothetical protein